jgi:peptidoglycan hydrolase CwlO-like protein
MLGLFTIGGGAFLHAGVAHALTDQEKAQLQAEYDQLQAEIAQWQKVLDDTRAKKSTLQGDVTALNAQIAKATAEIKQRNVTISTLGDEINQKTANIATLEQRLDAGHESLAKLLRQKNEAQTRSLVMLALSSKDLSSFFADVDDIDSIDAALQAQFDDLRATKDQTEKEKEALDAKQNQELDARHDVEVKKQQISDNQAEKKQLLAATTNQEQSYQQVLADRQKRADQIRTALFELRDAEGIPFATALDYANVAQQKTGVRAAFILGILRQESNLGVNVGQCYLTDPTTGAGRGKNTGTPFKNVMKPDRDVQPFLDLMSRLGKDPYSTPVSCPLSVGYGGAMGPSQFIASTWKSYESKISAALGVATPDPWMAEDAIMATALYLKGLGADKATYSAEREAAARYYAGANWQKSGLGYASSVLSYADQYQENIDFLNGL